MDEDEEYVAPVDGVEDEDDEIEDLDEAWEDENQPAVPEDEGEISDYADENESESEDEESDEEEEDGKKKKKKKKRKGKLDDWQAKPEEELNIKPYKMADKYARARAQVESIIQTELKITQPVSPVLFASTDDYDRFVEDREQFVYNIANKHMEAETISTLKARLQKLKGAPLAQYTEEEHVNAARRQIAVNYATLQFKIEKRVMPLMNAVRKKYDAPIAQPSGQGGREVTLAAAQLARKQLTEAAKWLAEEDELMDEELKGREVKAMPAQAPKIIFAKRGPTPAPGEQSWGPKPLAAFPPPIQAGKDDSYLATGYGRRIIEQRGFRELRSGLGLKS